MYECISIALIKLNAHLKDRELVCYVKIYLFALYLFIHLVALFDHQGLPYYPIQLSSLLLVSYTRKAIFLAGIGPVCIQLWCVRDEERWPLKGIGLSLFIMTLFDEANDWPLHLLGVCIFAYCLFHNTKVQAQRELLNLIILLYVIKSLLDTYRLTNTVSVLILKCMACLQWLIFFLLSLVITE